MLLHPSAPTSFNSTSKIVSQKSRDDILSECGDPELNEIILQKHCMIRLFSNSDEPIKSGLQIKEILSVWAYIHKL